MKCFLKTCLLLIFLVALNSLYGQYGIGYGPADVTYDRRGNQIMSANGFSWTYQCWVADIWYTWGSLNGQCRHSYYKDVYRIFDISPRNGNLTLPDGAWTLENGACRNSDFSVVDLRNLVFLPYNDHQRYPAVVSSGAFAGSHIGTLFLPNSFPQYEGAQYDYSISEGAFEDCVIDTLYVPNCIQELSKTFAGSCKTVKAVIVNEGVSGMDLRRLLSGCESVKSVTLPMGFKQIGEYGFSGVGALDTVNLPDDLEKIGDYAFLNCDSLLSITVPAGVMAIGRGAFNGCKTLSKIVFSGDRPSVVDYLTDADKRSSLVVYVNVARNGWEDVKQSGTWLGHPVVCYREDEDWLYEEREGRITVTRCKKPRKSMTIPGTCDGLPVYAIGSNVFSASPDIMELTVSEGVEVIDTGAFENCTALSTIRLPDSLREIRANAFVGCNGVREINLPCGLEEFGLDALSAGMVAQCRTINDCLVFQNWVVGHNETNVQAVFPEGVQGVGRNALSGCMAIRDAALPASVVHIASGAFANDYYLETAELPDSVVTIGQGAYSNCTELVTLTFGAGVDKVGEGAFLNCISLKDVDLMSSHVRVLGPYSFSGPLQIRSVALPLSLEQVDASAFKGCQQITSVVVPAHVKPLKDLFPDSYRKITEVVIADGEKQIVPGMFADCVSLQRIVFPPSLEKVGEAAFQNCTALSELDIPDSIWSIGERAFSGCSNLQRVDLPVNLQEIASGLFEKCQSLKSLVIPAAVRRLGNNIYSGIQGHYSWEYVSELSVITFLGDAPEVEEESYAGVPSSVTTFVRKGSTGWFLTGSPTLPPNGWPAHHSHPIDYSPSEYSVTLDPNGADGEQTCLAFQFGEECVLPRCPFMRLGYEFAGWAKDPNGVAIWQDQARVDGLATSPGETVILYATWKKDGREEPPPPVIISWRVVFDANGGGCEDSVRVVRDGDLLGALPTATRSKFKFNGWYTAVSGGEKVSTMTRVTCDATYYAQWVIDSSATCEISFDPNGGICPESSRVVAVGKSLESFPVCGRMGYKLDGWYTSAGGGVRVLESSPITSDVRLYAHWETINVPYELGKLYGTSESGAAEADWEAFKAYADSSHVPVVFIGGTRNCSYCRKIHDSVLGTDSWDLPCLMYYDYYTTISTWSTKEYATWFRMFDWDHGTAPFAACYWNVDGKQKIESVFTLWAYDSIGKKFLYVDGDQIRKEKICEKILDVFASQVGRVVVRFVSDVGECREVSRPVLLGGTVGELPTLQANNYVFLGWFSEREGGMKITATTKVTKDMTLYAHWSFIGTPTVECALARGCDGMGSVSGGKTAKAGTKLMLKATAKKGYVFAGWYQDAEGWEPVEGGADYRSPSYAYVVGEDNATFYAKFIPVEDDWIEVETSVCSEFVPGVPISREAIGVYVMSESLPTVKVTGLPSGLKFDAKTLAISGTPTKSGVYIATVTATSAGKKTATDTMKIVVRRESESLVDAEWDASKGKVTGMGVCATGKTLTLKATSKKGYVFAGWYRDAEGEEPVEGGTDYRSPSYPYVVGEDDAMFYAKFIPVDEDWVSVWCQSEDGYARGVEIAPLAVEVNSASLATVKVTGLPTGLKFTAKPLTLKATNNREAEDLPANTIYGTPTKSGIYTATITATTAGKKSETYKVDFVIRSEGEYLVDVMGLDGADYPTNGSDMQHAIQWGKMSGYGVFKPNKTATLKATANKGYVFAGWFSEVACVCEGGEEDDGCVYTPAEGAVDYRSTSFPVRVGYEDVLYYARFVRAEDDDKLWANIESAYYLNGPWALKLDVESMSLPTIMVKGLPSGLKFNAKTLTISGTPTKPGTYPITLSLKNTTIKKARTQGFTLYVANIESPYLRGVDYANDAYVYRVGTSMEFDIGSCATGGYSVTGVSGLPSGLKFDKNSGLITGVPTKAGPKTVTITLKNGKLTSSATITLNVDAIDTWAYGTFNGGGEEGVLTLTVGNTGKISGKWMTVDGTWTLSAKSYESYDEMNGSYLAVLDAKCGKEKAMFALAVYVDGQMELRGEHQLVATAKRNVWKEDPWKDLATQMRGASFTLTDGVSLKVGTFGAVTASGKFVTGQNAQGKDIVYSASCSTVLVPVTENDFGVYLCFPKKNGKFDGVAIQAELEWDGNALSTGCGCREGL